jgi:hypothetical protein
MCGGTLTFPHYDFMAWCLLKKNHRVPGDLCPGVTLQGREELTTHLHPVPRLRMRGAIPPLMQCVFMAWCLVKQGGWGAWEAVGCVG